jgi:hypothetical protein
MFYWEFGLKQPRRKARNTCKGIYNLKRVRVVVGNVLCRFSDMRDTWWGTEFAFESLTVTVRTMRFNVQQFHLLPAEYVCFACLRTVAFVPYNMWLVVNARFQNCEKQLLASCPSFLPHGTTLLPKNGFFMKFDIWVFFTTIVNGNSSIEEEIKGRISLGNSIPCKSRSL